MMVSDVLMAVCLVAAIDAMVGRLAESEQSDITDDDIENQGWS